MFIAAISQVLQYPVFPGLAIKILLRIPLEEVLIVFAGVTTSAGGNYIALCISATLDQWDEMLLFQVGYVPTVCTFMVEDLIPLTD